MSGRQLDTLAMLVVMNDKIKRIAETARFRELYEAGWTLRRLAAFYGVSKGEISLAVEYLGLPRRVSTPDSDMAPNEHEEEASMHSLALAPGVEARARIERQIHFEQRRREHSDTTRRHLWLEGKCQP